MSLSDAILTGLSAHVVPLGFAVVQQAGLYANIFRWFYLLKISFLKTMSDLKKSFHWFSLPFTKNYLQISLDETV